MERAIAKRILFVIFNVIYLSYAFKVLEKSSDGLTTSGFEKLEKGVLFIHINHRDILLDTTLMLNFIRTWCDCFSDW
jgi:hypothetical protein